MSRTKSRPKERHTLRPRTRRPLRYLLIGGALLLAIGALFAVLSSASKPDGVLADGPRLAVDRQEVDFGKVPVEKLVTAIFTISNVGDQPLRLLQEPQVQVVEGC